MKRVRRALRSITAGVGVFLFATPGLASIDPTLLEQQIDTIPSRLLSAEADLMAQPWMMAVDNDAEHELARLVSSISGLEDRQCHFHHDFQDRTENHYWAAEWSPSSVSSGPVLAEADLLYGPPSAWMKGITWDDLERSVEAVVETVAVAEAVEPVVESLGETLATPVVLRPVVHDGEMSLAEPMLALVPLSPAALGDGEEETWFEDEEPLGLIHVASLEELEELRGGFEFNGLEISLVFDIREFVRDNSTGEILHEGHFMAHTEGALPPLNLSSNPSDARVNSFKIEDLAEGFNFETVVPGTNPDAHGLLQLEDGSLVTPSTVFRNILNDRQAIFSVENTSSNVHAVHDIQVKVRVQNFNEVFGDAASHVLQQATDLLRDAQINAVSGPN